MINFARKEIEAKVVYYGPAFSGKTTNVQKLHELMPAGQRGELHSLATEADRTLFFDYVPIQLGKISGFDAKFKLFTVPGQVVYQQTRRVVLQGADAVVFVADSTPDRADSNLDSLVDLEENLRAHGMDLTSVPLVIQLNKRDAPGARAAQDMLVELNPFGVPCIEAVAATGQGVLETLKRVTEIAAQRIKENLAGQKTAVKVQAVDRAEAEDDRRVIREHIERIRKVRPEETAREQQMHAAGRIHVQSVDAFKPQGDGGKALLGITEGNKEPAPQRPARPDPDNQGAATQVIGSHLSPLPGGSGASGGYEVSRPMQKPPPPRVIPPPPPAPPPKIDYPAGGALDAWIEGEAGIRGIEVLSATVAPDGNLSLDAILDRGGGPHRHRVTVSARRKAPRPDPALAPPAAGGGWLGAGVAAILGAGLGAVAGIAIGWLVFGG